MNTNTDIYHDISTRTAGDIYIGVVGPVRAGKSTFIKRFMETQVIPHIENSFRRERAKDELPQSGSGRTVMTAEPKFVPEEAVDIALEDGGSCSVRLIDCVGYMVPGAAGQFEGDSPRMVSTPWLDYEIPMSEAAEIGTGKVIREHSTIGIVITTDGSITDIPREDYVEAEGRVIRELQEIGKPFLVLLNAVNPASERVRAMAEDIAERYGVCCLPVNCLELDDEAVAKILKAILYEFPLTQLEVFLPAWVEALDIEHPIKRGLYRCIRERTKHLRCIREVAAAVNALRECEGVSDARVSAIRPGSGIAAAELQLPRELFYETLSAQSGFAVKDDGDLFSLLTELSTVKTEYDKVAEALKEAKTSGYGIVVPTVEELSLEEPEIMKQGGRYGVRLKASAPSIHMIRADIETTVAPIVGNEKQSEDMVNYLLQEFEGDTGKIWQSNIFGRSFHEIVSEDLHAKLKRMPDDARGKLRETLERIINEGSGGLICIIL
ncbi:MAG: stage IV sporulation protein A [Oscillospiraceae bacterium]|nr:stage IV sporulation protein A [Oscillospiraceae bacterium]MBQ5738887.1 stage IV sporulation protein A [Oscillospiraceae bacterium]